MSQKIKSGTEPSTNIINPYLSFEEKDLNFKVFILFPSLLLSEFKYSYLKNQFLFKTDFNSARLLIKQVVKIKPMSTNEHIDILKLHLTNELFQQYAKALQSENVARDQQNRTLYSQLNTIISENNQLKEKLQKAYKQSPSLAPVSLKATPIKKLNAQMAQSHLFQDPYCSNNKVRNSQIIHLERESYPKSSSMTRTQITEPCDQQDELLNYQQILSFIDRVQQDTLFISHKYQELKLQRDIYLGRIKKLESANLNLQKMLRSEMNLRKNRCQNKQNDHNLGRNTERCVIKTHPVTGEDIIQFKPQNNAALFFCEQTPKSTIKKRQVFKEQSTKQDLQRNERVFINSYRDSIKKQKI